MPGSCSFRSAIGTLPGFCSFGLVCLLFSTFLPAVFCLNKIFVFSCSAVLGYMPPYTADYYTFTCYIRFWNNLLLMDIYWFSFLSVLYLPLLPATRFLPFCLRFSHVSGCLHYLLPFGTSADTCFCLFSLPRFCLPIDVYHLRVDFLFYDFSVL